jgi:site-specific DNA recombinase
MRTIGYIRVSTDKQAEQGVSLDAQRAKLTAYAGLYDLELVGIEADEGASAKTLERPALQRALAMLDNGQAEALLVVKLDRLTRSVKDLGTLIENYFARASFTLLSVNDQIDTRTATGRLVLNLLTSVTQWEREAIGERTSAAMQYMRSQGQYTGGVAPYGWKLEGEELVPDLAEQAVIEAARALRAAGLSLRKIGLALLARGAFPRSGVSWHPQQVKIAVAARTA